MVGGATVTIILKAVRRYNLFEIQNASNIICYVYVREIFNISLYIGFLSFILCLGQFKIRFYYPWLFTLFAVFIWHCTVVCNYFFDTLKVLKNKKFVRIFFIMKIRRIIIL